MEFIVFVALPLLLGAAIMAGLLILVKIMPGDGKAAPAAVAAPDRAHAQGPEYEKLAPKRKAAFRVGYVMLVWLAFLAIAEVAAGLWLKSLSLLLIVNIVEAASILYIFMHIKTVWSSEETH